MAQDNYMTEYALTDTRKNGRLIVSGGDSIAEYYEADITLPTLYVDDIHKPFLECIIAKGTFMTLKAGDAGHAQDGKTVASFCDGTHEIAQGLVVLDAFPS
jgi:hypothetical protein